MTTVATPGPLAGLEYLVVRQNLMDGALSVVGAIGYPPGARAAAEQAARAAVAAGKERDLRAVHAVVRISEQDVLDARATSWLWVSEMSYGGATWLSDSVGGPASAGVSQGPQQAEAAAAFFLQQRLAAFAPDTDDFDVEDDWWRVSVWDAARIDESQHPAEGGRIRDRAQLLGTPEKLAWLGGVLRADRVHADAVATATPRQVTRIITGALNSDS